METEGDFTLTHFPRNQQPTTRARRWPAIQNGRAALVVAHPGHELRVYGWLEFVCPSVFVLTDGSGRTGHSRLDATSMLLARVGAEPKSLYGRFTDAAIYAAILDHNVVLFTSLAEELATTLVREHVEYVVGDALEGYNPVHDICRYVINVAVVLAQRACGRRLANFDFPVIGQPDACPEELRDQAAWLRLDDTALARKLTAARNYAELAAEVQAALDTIGAEAFRIECLRPVAERVELAEVPPFYERYGEQRVAARYYQRVLRYHEHMLPLAEALRAYAEGRS